MTVAVLTEPPHRPRDVSLKSVREHMDMRAGYREVGSYRAAAKICGTTPKTVKRSVLAARASENGKSRRRAQLARRQRSRHRSGDADQGKMSDKSTARGSESVLLTPPRRAGSRLHRRLLGPGRSRADLRRAAVRPVDVLRGQEPPAFCPLGGRRGAEARDRTSTAPPITVSGAPRGWSRSSVVRGFVSAGTGWRASCARWGSPE